MRKLRGVELVTYKRLPRNNQIREKTADKRPQGQIDLI